MPKFGVIPALLKYLPGKAVEEVAAAQLPPPPTPKAKSGFLSRPAFLQKAGTKESKLTLTDRNTINTDLTTYRSSSKDTRETIKNLSATLPDLSASVDAYIRTAITDSFTAVAYNMDGTFNKEATNLLQQLVVRMDVMRDYAEGFSNIASLRSISESLAKQLRLYGSCALELVLDKSRLPYKLQPISVTTIDFYSDDKQMWPVQKPASGGDEINLDVPTFFYASLDQDLDSAYSDSPMEPALQPVLFSQDFMNDIRRVVKKALHPRMTVKLDQSAILSNLPPEIAGKTKETGDYVQGIISSIADQINGLQPEDALVHLDNMTVEYLGGDNPSLNQEYQVLTDVIDSKVSTGVKTLPAVLGHGSASSNIASAETMLFTKNAEGAVQAKLNEIYSQALTLAVRLFGLDAYVEFKYSPVDLRPKNELEAFAAMKQSRILELLSLGLISDDQACLELTGRLAPADMKPLSGTGFRPNTSTEAPGNPYSNTSTGAGGGALNQNLKPTTPQQPKGAN